MTTAPTPVPTVARMAYNPSGPNATPLRNIRVPDDIWQAAKARAQHDGTNVTAILVAYLKRYGKDYREPSANG